MNIQKNDTVEYRGSYYTVLRLGDDHILVSESDGSTLWAPYEEVLFYERAIEYPISMEYVQGWGNWEIVREIVSNARDADPGYFHGWAGDFDSKMRLTDMAIFSQGFTLLPEHMLLGVSQKSSSNAIGQFGEGLKLALQVLTRMERRAHIFSGALHYWNEPSRMEGHDTFRVVIQRSEDDEYVNGVLVVIPDWYDELYDDRFLREGDPRVAWSDFQGRAVLLQEDPDLFIRGVWTAKISDLGRYSFGYNLADPKMNRDRAVVSTWDFRYEAARRIWAQVGDPDLLERFYRAVHSGAEERNLSFSYVEPAHPDAHALAFQRVAGFDARIRTSDSAQREAEHRGAKVVDLGEPLADFLGRYVGTDLSHVEEHARNSVVPIGSREMTRQGRRTLNRLQKLAKILNLRVEVAVINGESRGQAVASTNTVIIDFRSIEDTEEAISIFIHEAAHLVYHTKDRTVGHQAATESVAAALLVGVMK